MSAALVAVAAALLAWPGPPRTPARLGPRTRPARSWSVRRLSTSPWFTAAFVGFVVAVVSTPLVAVLAAGCAALGTTALGRRRAAAGADAQLLALAEALGVLAAELRAGRPLAAAAEAAADACPDPAVRHDLARALRPAVGAGRPDTDVGSDVRGLAGAVRLSLRTGCSMAAVAGALEDDLRASHRHRLELRTATAGPRASAVVLAGLPALGLAMGAGVGADPWQVLTTTVPGQVLLVVGVLLELAGIAWVDRVTRRAAPELGIGRRRG